MAEVYIGPETFKEGEIYHVEAFKAEKVLDVIVRVEAVYNNADVRLAILHKILIVGNWGFNMGKGSLHPSRWEPHTVKFTPEDDSIIGTLFAARKP